ncbi:hypothetical protein AZH53_03860 [Methanomicrobiaceae archaeon CYW5]|uniref:hypothetical protein n=1 Tax=Methanovulcanius yangii TaxID=1789227 RepID=UPI0029CA1ADA|nr:hypothetical protein [Methanovulcanius yangii]MBT8507555.1 hypothetical protein [Methanovulcanius yangii]
MTDILGIISFAPVAFAFFEKMKERIQQEQNKDELSSKLRLPFEKFENCHDELICSYYMIFGAYVVGNFTEPSKKREIATQIADDFVIKFDNFKESMVNLIQHLKGHQDSIKNLYADDYVQLESVIAAFETQDFDYQYFFEENAGIILQDWIEKKEFPTILSEELEGFCDKEDLGSLMQELLQVIEVIQDPSMIEMFCEQIQSKK